MPGLTILIYLVVLCVYSSIWGWAVNRVIENKGYRENWFWWGFFFGIIALIVALTKPNIPRTASNTGYYKGYGIKTTNIPGGWKCTHCGAVNAGYVGTCGCGCNRAGNMSIKANGKRYREQNNWKCRQCGRINESYVGTCGCGCRKPNIMMEKDTEKVQQKEQSQILYCNSCGKQIEEDSKFCRHCGLAV